ncbi:RNA-directed DNA polymerase, partial [Desulfofundulus thermosubterraneus]
AEDSISSRGFLCPGVVPFLITVVGNFLIDTTNHTIENQLIDVGFPNQAIKWILRLLESVTAKVSRGIPIGPHAVHLLAEASIRPVDNSLVARGIKFCRFSDDIIIFCNSKVQARTTLYTIAEILDKQQRLMLQRQKTKIFERSDFQDYCRCMVEDRPINDLEAKILNIIRKYSNGNPYQTVLLSQVSDDDLKMFTPDIINTILEDYLNQTEPNYVRLRWFIRRLTQVGHPSAIDFCITNFNALIPALSEVCRYFISIGNHPQTEWPYIGAQLIELLDNEIISSNEYFQMSILSLFNKKTELNQVHRILGKYGNASPNIRREILLVALANNCADWIRELKEQYAAMDLWTKRAFLAACKLLPVEERKFFTKIVDRKNLLDGLLVRWVRQK